MRILLIYRIDISELSHSGVLLKMACQKKALERLGHVVSLINHDQENIYKNGSVLTSARYKKGTQRYFYNYYRFFKLLSKYVTAREYDLIYIRYPFSTPSFLKFSKKIKSDNPECKLVLELPTFPYNQEFKGRSSIFMRVDNYCRKYLHKYYDRVVHFGEEESLLNIPAISVTNGIDIDAIKERSGLRLENTIRLVAIAKWFYWHGLDRVINGLAEYARLREKKYKIDLTVVGEGPELNTIKALVEEKNLRDLVCFVGVQRGEELDRVFDHSDVGVGTLGIHRKNLKYNASLKHREFCARGLPFILSTTDSAFDASLDFVHYCARTDEPVSMDKVIALHEKKLNKKAIREYAVRNLDWTEVMSQILKALEA